MRALGLLSAKMVGNKCSLTYTWKVKRMAFDEINENIASAKG